MNPPPDPIRSAFVTAVQLLEAGRASLLLRRNGEPVLVVAASVGITPSVVPSIRVSLGQGIAGVVAERGLSLFGVLNSETFVSAPILTERGVEGVLNLTNRLGGKQYSAADIAFATTVTRHIAHLLEYSRYVSRDPVSGLPNRRAFEEALEREVSRHERTGSVFSVVYVDLNRLKPINDRYGHARGDEVIRAVGNALQHEIRLYDFAGRIGGDEFALLLSGPADSESSIVRRFTDAVARVGAQMEVDTSISLGIARCPEDGATAPQLLSTADARMYESKRARTM